MSRKILINPYENVEWESVNKYEGNLHAHSTESDGRQAVANLIDQCKDLGLDMFVLSDHDSYRINRGRYPKVLDVSNSSAEYYDPARPTGKYRNIFPFHYFDGDLYYDPNDNGNYTELERVGTKGEFDIVDDKVKGMLTFEACEFTENHHIISVMSDEDGNPGGKSEEELIRSVDNKGGFTYFAHPGRHWDPEAGDRYDEKYTAEWYRHLLDKYKSCLGVEILNVGDKFYNDRKMWDHINNLGFHPSPIYGFSGGDIHHDYNRVNYNVFFMEDLTVDALKSSLEKGEFYACHGENSPIITKVEVNESNGTIEIETENSSDSVSWVSCGSVIGTDKVLNYNNALGLSGFVRAVVQGVGGTAYLNPIHFSKFVYEHNFIR